jgi:hypothetical protein
VHSWLPAQNTRPACQRASSCARDEAGRCHGKRLEAAFLLRELACHAQTLQALLITPASQQQPPPADATQQKPASLYSSLVHPSTRQITGHASSSHAVFGHYAMCLVPGVRAKCIDDFMYQTPRLSHLEIVLSFVCRNRDLGSSMSGYGDRVITLHLHM